MHDKKLLKELYDHLQMLKWMSLPSSYLYAVEYIDDEQLLKVEFQSGAIFQYSSVPKEVYEKLLTVFPYKSKDGKSNYSLGSWFYYNVRDKYNYKQL